MSDKLIEELQYNAQHSGGRPLERRLADLTLWYKRNRDRIPPDNLASRYALMDKALWISFEALALAVERIHELEGQRAGAHIWVPKGVAVNGDLRKFG